ncbi:hypothetical protein BH20ACT15_BH20ACT15_03820 [soil metagenome]
MPVMKFAFLPVSILGGFLAAMVGQRIFEQVWALVDEEEPPDAKHREIGVVKLAIALIIEGAIFRLIRGLFDHGARRGFARYTGAWPGEEAPDEA